MNSVILRLAEGFCLRQLAKFGDQVNWQTVKTDFDVRVRQVVPGDFMDDDAVTFCNAVIDGISVALKDSADIGAIVTSLTTHDLAGAQKSLRALLTKAAGQDLIAGLLAAA